MSGRAALAEERGGTRLQVSISSIFALLILPALAAVVAFSYYENERKLLANLERFVDGARDDAIRMSRELIDPVAATLRLTAETARVNPGFFRSEASRDFLITALTSAEQIDAVYTSFEDGYHRVMTRIDDDRRRSDPKVPPNANWHSSYIDAFGPGVRRQRHRTFFDSWPHEVGGYSVDTAADIRTLPHYKVAKQTSQLAVADPSINPDTGYPVVSLAYPIGTGPAFGGIAAANITLDVLSRFLEEHRASPNSVTIIADMAGNVVAHPDKTKGVRRAGGKLELAKVSELPDFQVAEAVRQRASEESSRFVFTAGPDKVEYVALFSNFPAGFAKQWEVLIVTPTDDFIGDLKQTNRRLIWLVIGLTALESGLIYFMVHRIAQPIERAAEQIQRIRSLTLDAPGPERSRVREIARLQGAVSLLHNALRSFSVFVPVGIVRELIESGKPLAPSVEPRFMTVFFTDLENFSTIAQTLSPEELSRQATMYFESVTEAIALERGTVDKFIGDSVMAFWGAPAPCEDHVWLGCRAALRASNRMRRMNELWRTEGRPTMRLRVGLHCANVVVGNIGAAARLSYTVMGDGVNVASRLEGVNKQFGTSICISDSVYEQVADRVLARPIHRLSVKGRVGEFLVYELLGIVGSADPELQPHAGDEERSRLTAAALALVDQGRFADAVVAYNSVLAAFPDDGLARTMRDVAAKRPAQGRIRAQS